ncbi:hypothetical protein GGD46_004438, partial [Rhizobium lusitanum]|nr:hypothetical protein [Rhizobium lusitanum]
MNNPSLVHGFIGLIRCTGLGSSRRSRFAKWFQLAGAWSNFDAQRYSLRTDHGHAVKLAARRREVAALLCLRQRAGGRSCTTFPLRLLTVGDHWQMECRCAGYDRGWRSDREWRRNAEGAALICSLCVAATLHKDVEDEAHLIDGTPKPDAMTISPCEVMLTAPHWSTAISAGRGCIHH